VVFGFALAAAACGAGGDDAVSPDGPNNSEEAAFLDITVATSDGGQLDWGTLQGQDVVVWFWAPW
jgi:hypothetical protein